MEKIIFRQAVLNDLPSVLDITKRAYGIPYKENTLVTSPHEPEDVKNKFIEKEFFIIVAESENNIIGSVRYKFLSVNEAYLYNLAVLKEFRNKNIGPTLVSEVEKTAKEQNCKKLTLDCAQEKGLSEYYEKLGFKIDEIKKHHDHHDVYMSKII